MREIPPLRTLVLRFVGPAGCHPEVTFGGPHCRVVVPSEDDNGNNDDEEEKMVSGDVNNNNNNDNDNDKNNDIKSDEVKKDGVDGSDSDDDDEEDTNNNNNKESKEKESSPELVPENENNNIINNSNSNNNNSNNNKSSNDKKNDANSGSRILESKDIVPPDKPTITGRLLRSLRNRPVGDPMMMMTTSSGEDATKNGDNFNNSTRKNSNTMQSIALPRKPYSGPGRPNANDVDLSHPWMLAIYPPRSNNNNNSNDAVTVNGQDEGGDNMEVDTNNKKEISSLQRQQILLGHQPNEFLTIQNTNHAIDTLQLFIDALVESGRAGDTRLGIHFFREWTIAVAGDDEDFLEYLKEREKDRLALENAKSKNDTTSNGGGGGGGGIGKSDGEGGSTTNRGLIIRRPNKKRRKLEKKLLRTLPLGTLSLHNLSSASVHTFRSMEKAHVGLCLGHLDLTGVHGLTDSIMSNILCGTGCFPRIQRLSIKNCRKVTGKGIASLIRLKELQSFDCGGCFNIHPKDVISMIQNHPGTEKGTFNEIYASGLGWTDVQVEQLVDSMESHLRGLGVGFSPYISGPGLILTLNKVAGTLERLAIPFCDGLDDASVAALGRGLRSLVVLDVRGCGKVTSLTGLMDGRVSAGVIKFSSGAVEVSDGGEDGKGNKVGGGGGNVSSGGAGGEGDGSGQTETEGKVIAGHLFVLARYSGISKTSLEDTLRLHHQGEVLTCILDGGGIGGGIRR